MKLTDEDDLRYFHNEQDYAKAFVAKLPSVLAEKKLAISNDRLNLLNFLLSLSIGTGTGDHAAFTSYDDFMSLFLSIGVH